MPVDSNGHKPIITIEDFERGHALMDRGHMKTQARSLLSPFLGISVALDNGENLTRTIVNAGSTLGLEWTDATDGRDVRAGTELLGIETSLEGAEDDHKADKIKFYSQMIGLTIRSLFIENNPRQAAFIGLNTSVQATRDYFMKKTRKEAIAEGIDPKARDIGKVKGGLNGSGAFFNTLAPAFSEKKQESVTKLGNSLLVLGTASSIAGLVDMKLHVSRNRKHKS